MFPSLQQFLSLSQKYPLIPFIQELRLKKDDPHHLFKLYSTLKKNPSSFLLDSANATPHGRYTYFPIDAPHKTFQAQDLKQFPKVWRAFKLYFKTHQGPRLPKEWPPFYGGAAGILSYDAGRFFEPGWDSKASRETLHFPIMSFKIYNTLLIADAHKNKFFLSAVLPLKKYLGNKALKKQYEAQKKKVQKIAFGVMEKAKALGPEPCSQYSWKDKTKPILDPIHNNRNNPNRKYFLEALRKIQRYISAGDIYQANLSQRIQSDFEGTGLELYSRLRKLNPSPYSCFFALPGFELISSSPELLLHKQGSQLETRPIAGTRPRGKDRASDQNLAGELLLNAKERAEHVMLLDLARNDLGKVCESGSIQVTEKMIVEKYSHVMHIVSHVRGTIKEACDIFDSIAALFPGGTITGCPKVRCLQILDELELMRRGPFFGSAGWIGYQGDGALNLLIRTAVKKKSTVTLQVGSGIVADSKANLEYQESLHKAKALLMVMNQNENGARHRRAQKKAKAWYKGRGRVKGKGVVKVNGNGVVRKSVVEEAW
jgi:para-aminobenzoate synthetase component 1